MGSVLVAIFWIWCGISVVVLISRPFYRRAKARAASVASPSGSAVPATLSSAIADLDDPLPPSLPSPSSRPVERAEGAGDIDGFDPGSLFEPARDGSLFERPEPEGRPLETTRTEASAAETYPAETNPVETHAAETYPAETNPVASGSVPVRTRSVADVLAGIRMPCDLAPLTGLGALDDPAHVVFATEGHPAHRVGIGVGDELERIGCSLEPVDATTLWVERGTDSLEVRIHPDASKVMEADGMRFPTAPVGAVVVEFHIR